MKNSIFLIVLIAVDVLCLWSCEKAPKEYFSLTEGMTYKFEVVSKDTDSMRRIPLSGRSFRDEI